MEIAIQSKAASRSSHDVARLLYRGIMQRLKTAADLLVLPIRVREIEVSKCLMGGENSVEANTYAKITGALLRPSTPIGQSPHARLLQRYDAIGESLLNPETLRHTDYYKMAVECMDLTGSYSGAKTVDELDSVARRFIEDYRRTDPPRNHMTSPPVRVARVKDSQFYQVVAGMHHVAIAAARGALTIRANCVPRTVQTPLQSLLSEVMWLNGRRELYQPIDSPELANWTVVRKCSDRLAKMAQFLAQRNLAPPATKTYVDVGSSYGWFVAKVAALGLDAFGVERDPIAASIGPIVYGLRKEQIIRSDCVRFLKESSASYDVVSCFSVAHHFVMGNGSVSGDEFIRLVERITGRVLFFDTGQRNEYESLREWDADFIENWLRRNTSFREIHALGQDSDGIPPFRGSFGRMLFACVK